MSVERCAGRVAGFLVCGLAAAGASAQVPDILIKLDVRAHYLSERGGSSTVRLYDALGNSSHVRLTAILETGFQAVLVERLSRFPNDPGGDLLEEAYIEDVGYWRLGRQFLPFGQSRTLRENAMGAQVETTLGEDYLPLRIAWADEGKGRQQGLIGRLGTRFGISFAVGDGFGISPTSLVNLRGIGESPGRGRGYSTVVGLDASRRIGTVDLEAEFVAFRSGATLLDEDRDVLDAQIVVRPDPSRMLILGWCRDWRRSVDEYRIVGEFQVSDNVWLVPMLRARNSTLRDAGFGLRVRL
ncbi:MAG: hypothetical protein SNJ74_03160 [Fimbriimonadaceae bacterium]